MTGTDQYETPRELVAKMIACIPDAHCDTIADFAVGEGKLLTAAAEKWPRSSLIGTDVDARVVRRLRRRFPRWVVGRCDFLNRDSRGRCEALRRFSMRFSVILLNPPFSGKGGGRWKCEVRGECFDCSQALAFTLTALNLMENAGHLVAIIPTSCSRSDKDRPAWHYLRSHCDMQMVSENGGRCFDGCVAKTFIVHLRNRPVGETDGLVRQAVGHRCRSVGDVLATEIFRGKLQVHQANVLHGREGVPFVHSTELKDGRIYPSGKRIQSSQNVVQGPAVLLPRVGKPMLSKVVVYGSRNRIALSDCVLALRCMDLHAAMKVRDALHQNWESVARTYSATCAPYVTVSALAEVLGHLGIHATGIAKERG